MEWEEMLKEVANMYLSKEFWLGLGSFIFVLVFNHYYEKFFRKRLEKKIKKAEKRGHCVKSMKISESNTGDYKYDNDAYYYAKYKYIVNGKEYIYRYGGKNSPPYTINLYYMNSPRRVFHEYEDRQFSKMMGVLIPVAIVIVVINLIYK